ncbi:uncharacterized protein [Leptinotarsa decemlineata]|uniref:uncharacterized protein n=1 Tax=Leptinotarsa decemlineata TaxID=7539 RepID=UPI003D308EA9
MWKVFEIAFLISILISTVFSRSVTTAYPDDDSIEIPTKNPNRSPNNGFSIFRPADDAVFNFINKIVNTTYLSSKMALNRMKAQSETRKKIEDEIENFLEKLPVVPIPLLDDLQPVRSSKNEKYEKF